MKKILIGALFLLMLSGCSVASNNVKGISLTDAKSTVSFFGKKLNDANLGVKFGPNTETRTWPAFVWWISDDNKNIFINNAFSVGAEISVPALEMTPEQKADFEKKLIPITDLMDKELTQNGFTKNAKNSSENLSDTKFYDYVLAYKKDQTVCTLTLNSDYYDPNGDQSKWITTLVFACSDEFKKYYDEQIPYLNAVLDSHNKTFTGDGSAVTNIEKTYGDFSVVDFSGRREGHFSIFKSHYVFKGLDKQNFEYTEIYSGQEAPPCKIVDKYKIPKEITATCWSDDGLTEKKVK